MATGKNSEELRRQAIGNLAASREEITAEIRRVRQQLDPKRFYRQLVDRHKPLAVGIACAAAFVSVTLLVRRWRSMDRMKNPMQLGAFNTPLKSDAHSGLPGAVARAIFPTLVNALMVPLLLKRLERPRRDDSDDRFAG